MPKLKHLDIMIDHRLPDLPLSTEKIKVLLQADTEDVIRAYVNTLNKTGWPGQAKVIDDLYIWYLREKRRNPQLTNAHILGDYIISRYNRGKVARAITVATLLDKLYVQHYVPSMTPELVSDIQRAEADAATKLSHQSKKAR